MNQIYLSLWLIMSMLTVPLCASAVDFPEKPADAHFYVDEAGLLTEESALKIDEIASALLSEERMPVYVVTIQSLSAYDALAYSVDSYAAALFDHWGIGFPDRNYGMLLLVSKGDRKARIELGADWGREYDYQARQVMNELIIPAFKRGDFSTGISDGVLGLNNMARGLGIPQPTPPWWILPLFVAGIALTIFMIVNLFKTGRKGWAWVLIAALGAILFFIIKALLSNSGGGSSGGFGGGFSGGGGASGAW